MAENEVPIRSEQAVEPVSVPLTPTVPAEAAPAEAAPTDELVHTAEQLIASVQSASMRSLKSMLAQFMEKADAAITKLDGGVPPKKQG